MSKSRTDDKGETDKNDQAQEPGAGWPYAVAPEVELETIRRSHLRAEGNVRAVGTMAMVGTIVMGFMIPMHYLAPNQTASPAWAIYMVLAAGGSWVAGTRLRRLDHGGRVLYTALLAIGFAVSPFLQSGVEAPDTMAVAIGAAFVGVVDGFLLWLLWNRRATEVFSRHYREIVVPATADIPPANRFWRLVLVFLGLTFLVGLVGGVVAFAMAAA